MYALLLILASAMLGSDNYAEREAATDMLDKAGFAATNILFEAANSPNPEVRWRVAPILEKRRLEFLALRMSVPIWEAYSFHFEPGGLDVSPRYVEDVMKGRWSLQYWILEIGKWKGSVLPHETYPFDTKDRMVLDLSIIRHRSMNKLHDWDRDQGVWRPRKERPIGLPEKSP
jgi:hypothetical protein